MWRCVGCVALAGRALGRFNVGTPLPYALFSLTAMVMMTAVLYSWIRLRSRSIWPCYLIHAAHNAIIQKFVDCVTIENAYTKYFTTEFRMGLVFTTSLVTAYCWKRPGDVEAIAPAREIAKLNPVIS